MFTFLKIFFIFIFIIFSCAFIDDSKIQIKVSNTSSEIKLIEENFFEHEEIIHEIVSETNSVLKNLTKSLNNSSLYPKLLKVIREISEIVNGISKYEDDKAPSTLNGGVCESIEQNIKHLQFFIKKFACCQSKALYVTTGLRIKKISLKIQKAFNYHYLRVREDKILSKFASCLDSLTSEYKKFLWFLLTSLARETILLGIMVSYRIASCPKVTLKNTSTEFTTEMSELDAFATVLSTKTSSREIEEIDEDAEFDLKYDSKPLKLQSEAKTVKSQILKLKSTSSGRKINSISSKKNSSIIKNVRKK